MIIGRSIISELMKKNPPLVENLIKADVQIQDDGIDLTIGDILIPKESGIVDFDNEVRKICEYCKISPIAIRLDKSKGLKKQYNYYQLIKGTYIVRLHELVHIPKNMAAIIKPRSSLIRNGAGIESGLWDSGYSGTGYVKLKVDNPYGIKFAENARICQIIFIKVDGETSGYDGIFQNITY